MKWGVPGSFASRFQAKYASCTTRAAQASRWGVQGLPLLLPVSGPRPRLPMTKRRPAAAATVAPLDAGAPPRCSPAAAPCSTGAGPTSCPSCSSSRRGSWRGGCCPSPPRTPTSPSATRGTSPTDSGSSTTRRSASSASPPRPGRCGPRSGPRWLRDPALWTRLTSLLADALTLLLVGRMLEREAGEPGGPAAPRPGASRVFFAALAVLLRARRLRDGEQRDAHPRSPWAPRSPAGAAPPPGPRSRLLALWRPEGLVAAAVVALGARWRDRAVAAGLTLAGLAALTFYFGSPVPQSVIAKAGVYGTPGPWAGRFWWGWALPLRLPGLLGERRGAPPRRPLRPARARRRGRGGGALAAAPRRPRPRGRRRARRLVRLLPARRGLLLLVPRCAAVRRRAARVRRAAAHRAGPRRLRRRRAARRDPVDRGAPPSTSAAPRTSTSASPRWRTGCASARVRARACCSSPSASSAGSNPVRGRGRGGPRLPRRGGAPARRARAGTPTSPRARAPDWIVVRRGVLGGTEAFAGAGAPFRSAAERDALFAGYVQAWRRRRAGLGRERPGDPAPPLTRAGPGARASAG